MKVEMVFWKLLIIMSMSTHVSMYQRQQTDISSCRSETKSTECLKYCKMLIDQKKYGNNLLNLLARSCPRSEISFWKCFENSNFWEDFRRRAQLKHSRRSHIHKSCCTAAKHPSCEIQCMTTKTTATLLNENCGVDREPKFATCIHKAHSLQTCCSDTNDSHCKAACNQYFKKSMMLSVSQSVRNLEKKCGKNSKQMLCAMKQSDYGSVIHDLTNCCSQHTTQKCQRICQKSVHIADFKKLFAMLSSDCGKFDIQIPVYSCILKTPGLVQEPDIPVDIPVTKKYSYRSVSYVHFKHPCCARAKSPKCQEWCLETISKPSQMGLWDTMYLQCIQDPNESEVSSCMLDMLEPCKIASNTEEMQYCSNLNNRPLELFRRFNRYGDSSAQKLMKFWSDGLVKVMQYDFQFKDLRTCYPEKFKALACLLAVKPCSHQTPMLQVCRSDCEELLENCIDFSKAALKTTSKNICSVILPNNNHTTCLKVDNYLTKPKENVDHKPTLPCENQPCASGEICIINQNHDTGNPSSKPYECLRGCHVNGRSNLIIPLFQLAKLVVEEREQECYEVCECQKKIPATINPPFTVFGACKTIGCHQKRNCTARNREYRDGEVFMIDCNTCTCNDGYLICSKKNCGGNQQRLIEVTERSRRHHKKEHRPRTPCNCGSMYSPVCGVNGITYPNSCLAKCNGLTDDQLNVGDCQAVEPCNPYPCGRDFRCAPRRRACLTAKTQCPQYTCHLHDPSGHYQLPRVCSTDLKYLPVCGFDGVTYKSECLAHQSGTGVDYEGPCLPSYIVEDEVEIDRCMKIKCRPMKASNCELFIPQGSCCPVCGSVLRVLYHEQDLINHQKYISHNPITVVDVLETARQLQTVAECKLYGHLTVEGDLMFLMIVNSEKPTQAQVHACKSEAEKLQYHINKKSLIVTTNYYLSILKASTLETSNWTEKSSSANINSSSGSRYSRVLTHLDLILVVGLVSTFLLV